MTWLEELVAALRALKGIATYARIYDYIENHTRGTLIASRPPTPAHQQ